MEALVALLYMHTAEWPAGRLETLAHWIAEHSYGIYLSYVILVWLVMHPLGFLPVWIGTLALAGMLVAVPALIYRYVERPLMLAGSHLSRSMLRPRPALQPVA